MGVNRRGWRAPLLGIGLAFLVGACQGVIGDGGGKDGPAKPTDPVDVAVASLETSRFPRLSHLQWENTIRDLFGLNAHTGFSQSFTGDPLGGVFDNNETVLLVVPNLWADYQVAAEEVATMVVSDPALLATVEPANPPTDLAERATAYIQYFGQKAYRRPLIADEVASYQALFDAAQPLFEGDAFARGVRLTLAAFLQSPHFLYRVEASSEIGDDGLVHLDGWEVASKLSYMLWNTLPDDELFGAASAGTLTDPGNIMAHAERMLEDPRAHQMVNAFHAQLYQYDHYDDLAKDDTKYPDWPADFGDDLMTEAELFVDDVVFEGGGLRELLTSPFTYVNAELAQIYGIEGTFTDEFVRVELDAAERTGLLSRIGFLAANATSREQNTIHRGVFINSRILCYTLPSPPDNVPPLPPASDYDTNRDRIEGNTGAGTCGETCHLTLINPPGFAFENYDAVGAFSLTENGFDVDTASTFRLDGQEVSFDGPVEFSNVLAESADAHACYAKNWLQFGYGRAAQKGDDLTIEELTEASAVGNVQDLILALTQTKAFRTRAPLQEEEAGQ